MEPSKEALERLPRSIAIRYQVLPLEDDGTILKLGVAGELGTNEKADLMFVTRRFLELTIVSMGQLQPLIERYYPQAAPTMEDVHHSVESYEHRDELLPEAGEVSFDAAESSVVVLANALINQAIAMQASDIHFEPAPHQMEVRFRTDGVLQPMQVISRSDQQAIISRLKLMARMDIAEKRKPQDGRITMEKSGVTIDIRVSSLPTAHGEKLVLRILDKSSQVRDLAQLGIPEADYLRLIACLAKPQGMILVTGPTGSGKTTTLYAALSHLLKPQVNIMTVEDPIEYEIDGITQSQVKPEIDFTFASALRAFLRQDPDIIMVGEIRDQETVQMALRAAMTGHLVLSTVHTNDAAATVTRLTDLGAEPYLVASSLSLVIAQRLVRKLCPQCKVPHPRPEEALHLLDAKTILDKVNLYAQGPGCRSCNSTGFKGRTGVFEMLEITDAIRRAIHERQSADVIRSLMGKQGTQNLAQSVSALVSDGITSLEEALRVVG